MPLDDYSLGSRLGDTLAQAEAPAGLATGAPLTVPHDMSDSRSLSRTATSPSEDASTLADPSRTLTDLNGNDKAKTENSGGDFIPAESTLGQVEAKRAAAGEPIAPAKNILKDLPPSRKNVLLLCFCLAMFSEPQHARPLLTI